MKCFNEEDVPAGEPIHTMRRYDTALVHDAPDAPNLPNFFCQPHVMSNNCAPFAANERVTIDQ
jgi:hypothetical protein